MHNFSWRVALWIPSNTNYHSRESSLVCDSVRCLQQAISPCVCDRLLDATVATILRDAWSLPNRGRWDYRCGHMLRSRWRGNMLCARACAGQTVSRQCRRGRVLDLAVAQYR